MYASPSTNFFDAAKKFFSSKSVLPRLILINAGVFVLVYVVSLVVWLFMVPQETSPMSLSVVAQWLAVPSSIDRLFEKPWTVISYMFLHEGFLHLLFNMMMLYFGGIIFLQYLTQRQLLVTYLLGGIAGALLFIAAFNLFPVFEQANQQAVALGASASVLAIVVAIATYVPDYTVHLFLIGQIRLKYLAMAFIVLDFFSIQGNNPGGHIAHIGGALFGFIYIFSVKKNLHFLQRFRFSRKARMKVDHRNYSTNARPVDDETYNKRKVAEQQEIDHILDKIARSGYNSLNAKEKELLFRTSNKNR
ncbi:MAG: rhomboid family intramembrane serine protease [Bacteroidetes bacterium]|nr:rhomboid family intramembrane serine protease [Bacteroidota bacterium]